MSPPIPAAEASEALDAWDPDSPCGQRPTIQSGEIPVPGWYEARITVVSVRQGVWAYAAFDGLRTGRYANKREFLLSPPLRPGKNITTFKAYKPFTPLSVQVYGGERGMKWKHPAWNAMTQEVVCTPGKQVPGYLVLASTGSDPATPDVVLQITFRYVGPTLR